MCVTNATSYKIYELFLLTKTLGVHLDNLKKTAHIKSTINTNHDRYVLYVDIGIHIHIIHSFKMETVEMTTPFVTPPLP